MGASFAISEKMRKKCVCKALFKHINRQPESVILVLKVIKICFFKEKVQKSKFRARCKIAKNLHNLRPSLKVFPSFTQCGSNKPI